MQNFLLLIRVAFFYLFPLCDIITLMITTNRPAKDNDKEKKKKNLSLYALFILLAILAIVITLIFLLPSLMKKNDGVIRQRVITPNDITSTTTMDVDGSLTFTYEDGDIKENIKISTGASNYDIGDYNNPLYLYSMSDTHEYIFEIEYTVIGLSYKNISFTIELSDTSGNNKNTLPPSSYTSIDISNGKKMSYTSSGGELTIWGVTISYSVI